MDADPADAQGAGARLSGWSGRREIPIADGRGHLRLKRMEGPWRRTFHSRGGGVVPRSGIEPTRFLIRTHGVSLPSGSTRQRWGPSRRRQLAGPFRKTPMGSRVTRTVAVKSHAISKATAAASLGVYRRNAPFSDALDTQSAKAALWGVTRPVAARIRPDAVDASSGLLRLIRMISRVAAPRRRDP